MVRLALAKHGVTASLYTQREGEYTATGINVSPAVLVRAPRDGSAVFDVVSEVLVATLDPKLGAFPVPPRPGDVLTYKGATYPLVEGTGSIDSGEKTAAYRLRFRRVG
jgi:hypothetical protein